MSARITQMEPKDIIYVSRHARDVDRRELCATSQVDDVMQFVAKTLVIPGPAFCCISNGVPVAVGGIALHSPMVGTAWMWGTDAFPSVAVLITRFCKAMINGLIADESTNRVQAFSADFHTESHRWLKAIGMTHEGTMRKYGKDGEDFYIFSVVKE